MGRTYQSITVNAPIEKVWSKVKNFHDLSWAPNIITKLEVLGDIPGNSVGAKRILNDAFHESLVELNDENTFFKYSIDEGPSPVSSKEVSNYLGHVKLSPISMENSTFIEWSSKWENNDEPTYEFCQGIYQAMLNDLKKTFS